MHLLTRCAYYNQLRSFCPSHTHTHTHTHPHTLTHTLSHTHTHTHSTLTHSHTRTHTHSTQTHTRTHTHTHTPQEYQLKAQEDKERYIQEYVAYQETDVYKNFIRQKFPTLQSKKSKTDDQKIELVKSTTKATTASTSTSSTLPPTKVRTTLYVRQNSKSVWVATTQEQTVFVIIMTLARSQANSSLK